MRVFQKRKLPATMMTRRKLASVKSPWRPPWNSLSADCPKPRGRSSPWRSSEARVTRNAKFFGKICWLGGMTTKRGSTLRWSSGNWRRGEYMMRRRTRGWSTIIFSGTWRSWRGKAQSFARTSDDKSTRGRRSSRTTLLMYTKTIWWNCASKSELGDWRLI